MPLPDNIFFSSALSKNLCPFGSNIITTILFTDEIIISVHAHPCTNELAIGQHSVIRYSRVNRRGIIESLGFKKGPRVVSFVGLNCQYWLEIYRKVGEGGSNYMTGELEVAKIVLALTTHPPSTLCLSTSTVRLGPHN